jgi:hypothetical protein
LLKQVALALGETRVPMAKPVAKFMKQSLKAIAKASRSDWYHRAADQAL